MKECYSIGKKIRQLRKKINYPTFKNYRYQFVTANCRWSTFTLAKINIKLLVTYSCINELFSKNLMHTSLNNLTI